MYTSKKLVLISDKKAKAKTKSAKCLTDRMFFDKKRRVWFRTVSRTFFSLLMYVIKENGNLLYKL